MFEFQFFSTKASDFPASTFVQTKLSYTKCKTQLWQFGCVPWKKL